MRGLDIRFVRMGAVSSDDLFEEREQGLFDLYERLAGRYRKALDIGANIGIHTLLMARQGWEVRAYEPDPVHYAELCMNMDRNLKGYGHGEVQAFNAAVAMADGRAEFVRVLGNGTANHLAGSRGHHGEVERIAVNTVDCRHLFGWADFAKLDCEGMEAEILCAAPRALPFDAVTEVGTEGAALRIYAHFLGQTPMWAQRTGWGPVLSMADMPTHYSHGALFIGERP